MDSSDIENTYILASLPDAPRKLPEAAGSSRKQLRLYENEFEELNRQLLQERERIFKLVEMHTEDVLHRDGDGNFA